jgi:Icc-related predicted phosphoesterase
MKLVLLSDTHTLHDQVVVPEGDLLIHAGDLTYTGRISQFENVERWLLKQAERFPLGVIVIAGNHDFGAREFFRKGERGSKFYFLDDSGIEIEGVKFWGSSYTPTFGRWAYMADRGDDIKKHWNLIPDDTDVLITHGPLWGILDSSEVTNGSVGCEDLHDAVFDRVQPKVHVFGHIHGGYGHKFKIKPNDVADIRFYNASVVNEDYEVVNKPWETEI